MKQQEIDKIVAECKEITKKFRKELKPAVDENNQPIEVDKIKFSLLEDGTEEGKRTGKKRKLREATAEQVQKYIKKIQKLIPPDAGRKIYEKIEINLSYLYIACDTDEIMIEGELPCFNCQVTTFHGAFNNENKGCISSTKLKMFPNFKGAKFKWNAKFHFATFENRVSFNSALFEGYVYFDEATFYENVSFNSAKFKTQAHFKKCTFFGNAFFHSALLYQDTSFEGAKFLRCELEEDYRAYRTLKQHMNSVHAKLEENMFFALEQKTRQYLDIKDLKTGKIELLPAIVISKFYDGISEYGQSLFKPIWQLFVLWAIFPGIYILPNMVAANKDLIGKHVNSCFSWMPAGYGYSTQNVFNPLGAINIFNSEKVFYPLNIGIAAMGWLEAILSLAIITLWLLAVRRRFQKGE